MNVSDFFIKGRGVGDGKRSNMKKCSPRNVPAVLSVGLAGARSSFKTSPGSPFLFMPTLEVSMIPSV